MGLRITTWNVNGIRNPFGYQPWRGKRSFTAMFDVLEADIVVFQETKIQRKDLVDDMVLVPGWDCYFSLPKYKKGYSGVVIYTRQAVCAPIRAEEGITGILCPPNSSTSFSDLPEDQQIGGYPTPAQLSASVIDSATLDCEGRCVVLEFPAFVLFGVYCPANRDDTRDDFRLGFLAVLDARIRNVVAIGKRVLVTGDLNISREELDAANAEASMRKQGLSDVEFVSTSSRRLFNHLLDGGKIFGERDLGRENPVLWDLCRAFHPDRKGMFTCWEQKTNARPGNCGARIDYVLCSLAMKDWFCDSNIQEGLMGSDHCPVYAVMKDKILFDGDEHNLLDVMNPPGMFLNGDRQRAYSTANDPLPLSGKLIPEFFGRRYIRDMFARKPSIAKSESIETTDKRESDASQEIAIKTSPSKTQPMPIAKSVQLSRSSAIITSPKSLSVASKKRSVPETSTSQNVKRSKSGLTAATAAIVAGNGKGQQSLKGFFKPKAAATSTVVQSVDEEEASLSILANESHEASLRPAESMIERAGTPELQTGTASLSASASSTQLSATSLRSSTAHSAEASQAFSKTSTVKDQANVHDPIESKDSWSKLFTKPVAPRCEGHDEPCITLLTKKNGMNLGRSFWMCPRPLGPSGAKEKNTQWRCQTFIWCSDWNPNSAARG